jgi:aminoglycoside phosphotransferase (APT) family kinase protein
MLYYNETAAPDVCTESTQSPRLPPRAADPNREAQVAKALLTYLKKRFNSDDLRYLNSPVPNTNGWETHTYRFRLAAFWPNAIPGEDRPLVLRIHCSPQGLPRARHEFAVQRHLHNLDYPVPEPFLLEESCALFGGPFLIMEEMAGQTLYENLLFFSWMMWPRSAAMAAMHSRLHRLPIDGFPRPPGPYLTRRLDELRSLIRKYRLDGLLPGWKWLADHRPPPPVTPCILHLDFHPFNLLCGWFPSLSVLDWTEADVGDHHADVATSLMLMSCCSAGKPNAWERFTLPVARRLVSNWYLRSYAKRIPLDRGVLDYYRAVAALKRLCGYGRWLRASPLSTGCKPSSIHYLNARHLETLQDYFRQYSGVAISLVQRATGM